MTGPIPHSLMIALVIWSGSKPLHSQSLTPTNYKPVNEQKAAPASSNYLTWHAREGKYYQRNWGIDVVDVRRVASGEMLVFRYIVLDPEKSKPLNEVRNAAYLVDEKSGVHLKVPQMEKVGSLRTTVSPKAGRMYWMVFANTGAFVKTGSLVDVVVGDVHVNGLTVLDK